jgi:hypothetical protein
MTNSLILYIGEREAGLALSDAIQQRGGFVYLPENLMQALGMYVTYFPHITVIDMQTAWAQEVYAHLRSVDAQPLVLLTDQRVREFSVHTLPPYASAEQISQFLDRISERVPNGVLQRV